MDVHIAHATPRDLGQRAQDFREQWLAPSGGWLSELVITLSDLTGIWDIIILSGIFVGSWIVLRTSPMEISLILGFAFDLAIPLQYHNDEELSSRHEVHLQNYWPTFMIGCIVEAVSFFLLHPDLFTLIVCIKTTFCLFVWLSKDQEGLQIQPRRDSNSDRYDDRRSRPRRSSPSDSESEPARPSRSSSSPPSNIPPCKHVPDAYKYLKRAGYDDPAIVGMILTANQADKDKAKNLIKGWAGEKEPKNIERRNKEYGERAKKAGWKPSSSSGSDSDPSGNSGSQMPQSKYIPDAHKYLKRAGYDDAAIAGMILFLDQIGDKDKVKKQFAIWAQETDPKQIERRNAQYADRAAKAGWKGSSSTQQPSGQSSGGGSGVVDDGPPNMPTSYHIPGSKAYQDLKKAGYEDPAIAGMIIGMNLGEEKQAMNNYKIWTEEKDPAQIKRRNGQYGKTGKEAGFPDKAKMNAEVGGSPAQRMKQRLGIPVGSVNKVEKALKANKVDASISKQILDTLKNPKSEQDIKRAINTLKRHEIDIKEPEFADGFGAPDGHGGYRDIVIGEDDREQMMRKMIKRKEFSREQVDGWERFLRQPLSRRELEEKVLPFAKRIDAFIGEGYHGTGPHRFQAKGLEKIKARIQDENAVSGAVLDQAILHAINKKDLKEAQDLLIKWGRDGLTKGEIQQFAAASDWT